MIDPISANNSSAASLAKLGAAIPAEPTTTSSPPDSRVAAALLAKKPLQPLSYQDIAIRKVLQGFSNPDSNGRGKLIMPCGTGKTLVSMWIAEKIPDCKRILISAPSLALVKQIKDEWKKNMPESWKTQSKPDLDYLCVCSDEDVGKDEDTFIHTSKEINDKVTNDPDRIKGFINAEPEKTKVIFSTYQSLDKVAIAMKDNRSKSFDVGVADEAHRTTGRFNSENNFQIFHDEAKIPIKKRLYVTATPRYVYESEEKPSIHEHLCEMSNEKIYGPTFHEMSFGEAIAQEAIVDYEIVVVGIDPQEITKEGDHKAKYDPIEYNKALIQAMKELELQKTISFHSRVKRAEDFQRKHIQIANNGINCLHINGESKNREDIMGNFSTATLPTIITNAKCLTEGVNVPTVDSVYFCDEKTSIIDIIQAAGRALRKGFMTLFGMIKKSKAYIIVPVLKPIKGSSDHKDSNFGNLINVLKALRYQDERIAEYFWQNPNSTNGESSSRLNKLPIRCINIDRNFVISELEHSKPEIYGSWVKSFDNVKEEIGKQGIQKPQPKIKDNGFMETESEANIRFFHRELKLIFGFGWAHLRTLATAAGLGTLTHSEMVDKLWGSESFEEIIQNIRSQYPTKPDGYRAIRQFFDSLEKKVGVGVKKLVSIKLMESKDENTSSLREFIKNIIDYGNLNLKQYYILLADYIWGPKTS